MWGEISIPFAQCKLELRPEVISFAKSNKNPWMDLTGFKVDAIRDVFGE
jgi:hypothetical protein